MEGCNPHGNYGVCEKCRRLVPCRHEEREGRVYIVKDCPECGPTEALISSNAARWREKRVIWQYDPAEARACRMDCNVCAYDHHPKMLFLNITNRCNMNCPICIANIPGMGFEFHPPLSYFEKVLDGLAQMDPKPTVQLFGGEPTVRDDMFDIIEMARRRGLRVRIVTNGLRLADEAYCRKICEMKVPVLLSLDGMNREIYDRLRKNPGAFDKKMKAFENLARYSTRKNTIMCCVAQGINDHHMADLIAFCHANRRFINNLHLIPLTETWEEGAFETDAATNIEDVERIVDEAFGDERVEFLPAGLASHLKQSLAFFGSPRLTFGGAHPNCESATILFSDGERFHPINYFLKMPLSELGAEIVRRAKPLEARVARLDPKRFLQRWRGRLLVLRTYLGLARRAFDGRKIFRGNPTLGLLRVVGGVLLGRRLKDQLRRHTRFRDTLLMVILPFEEYHSIEGERLQNCPSGFAFLDPDTDRVKTIPVCGYPLYREAIERRIAEKYQSQPEAVPGG